MVLLIGGASHAGKTLLAQRLLERYLWPYTSLDHIKMGLIRGCPDCGFTALDPDGAIEEKLWGVVKGMVEVCTENCQNLILEGCYLPPERVAGLVGGEVKAFYLIFSPAYIRSHFGEIIGHEHAIERRNYPETRTAEEFVEENTALKARCESAGVSYYEIQSDYGTELQHVCDSLDQVLGR